MLSDAGYATRVVPPPPRRIDRRPFTSGDWSYLQSWLVAATADAYAANTTDHVHEVVRPLMDPGYGLPERMTALLDTASQRPTALAEIDPLSSTRSRALHDASTTLTTLGHGFAEARPTSLPSPTNPPARPGPARPAPPQP
ncbi:hypothetical protein [Peterkaempfera bronchialis]|uniref:hypothetical protein n=1 Tax=Peterkaempfera bronchialis TaxID=2126346 RepID=UPI003C2CD811